jgi:hypothetical protein
MLSIRLVQCHPTQKARHARENKYFRMRDTKPAGAAEVRANRNAEKPRNRP